MTAAAAIPGGKPLNDIVAPFSAGPLPAKGIMLDNRGSLVFAPHDVLRYIRNEGTQSLSFHSNFEEQ